MNIIATLDFHGKSIRKDASGLLCLTDMWAAAGSDPSKEPARWTKLSQISNLLEVLQNGSKSPVLKSKRGKGGGTWGTRQAAIAYTKYLSPEFHAWALQAIADRLEEEAHPELAVSRGIERAMRRYKAMGRDPMWIPKRVLSIATRNAFTSFVAGRGCAKPEDYRAITNATYTGVAGLTAKEWRERKSLPEKASLRDHLSLRELASVELAEALAMEVAERDRLCGLAPMAQAANRAGFEVQKAVRSALGGAA